MRKEMVCLCTKADFDCSSLHPRKESMMKNDDDDDDDDDEDDEDYDDDDDDGNGVCHAESHQHHWKIHKTVFLVCLEYWERA